MISAEEVLSPLFDRLAARDELREEERQALRERAGPPRRLASGTDMVKEGEVVTTSTLVTEGFAVRYRILGEGGRQIVAIHVPGDFVDLHGFLLKRMDHAVAALGPCTIVSFEHPGIVELTQHYPHLTRMLWLSTLLDASLHREWIVGLGRLSATARLAHLICELYVRLRVVGRAHAHAFDFPITQVDLADTLGISAVHVNRVLQDLREQGLIRWAGQQIEILDWDQLAEIAEFDDRYLHLTRTPR